MKKETVALSILGAGMLIPTFPIVASAGSTQVLGNMEYTYDDYGQLVNTQFRDGQLVANPANGANAYYQPKYYYGAGHNLTKKVTTDAFGQKYIARVPDGYYYETLREHQGYVWRDNCSANAMARKEGHFKPYSQKYVSKGCSDANYSYGTFNFEGTSGEWRFLGYNSYGDSTVNNPTFPSDHSVNTYPSEYEWKTNNGNKTRFDDGSFYAMKEQALQGAINLYQLGGTPSYWADRLSLQTDPQYDTPVFKGNNRNTGNYRSVHSPTSGALTKDINITKFEVLYNGEVIGIFTRDEAGNVYYDVKKNVSSENTYEFRVTVKNSGEANMSASQLKVQLGYALGYNAGLSDELNWFDQDNEKFLVTGNWLRPNESTTLSYNIKTNNLTHGTQYRATSVIDKEHYTSQNPDSNDKTNDWGKLLFQVDNGNMKAVSTELIDINGNVVNHAPIPGETYKVKYKYVYEGPDRNSPFDLQITNTVVRTLNNGSSDTYQQQLNKPITELVSHSDGSYIKNGDGFEVETPYMKFETPQAQASSALVQNPIVDSNPNDNFTSANYSDIYDLILQNVRIYPKTERPTTFPAKIKVGIKYDINVIAPDYIPHFETDVITQINANTSFVDHVHKGMNKDITRELEIIVNGTGDLPANVHINKPLDTNQRVWESDYTNNQGSTSDTINGGVNGDLVIANPENPNNGGCTLSGVKTQVDFNKVHNITKYNGSYIGIPLYKGSSSESGSLSGFYKYNNGDIQDVTKNYNESYKIEQILFKSKLTTDLGLGNDGWVDLKQDIGQIKAGYGYDLKIVVNYKTNAITTQPNIVQNPSNPLTNHGKNPNSVSSQTSNGTFVTNRNVMANVPTDIYVMTQDGKVLSLSGIYGTTKAFTSRELSNDNTGVKVEYSLIDGGKIYVDEATKDGKYSLKVYTPNVSGISGETLCDLNGVQFEVKGSMLDDNNDHIVQ